MVKCSDDKIKSEFSIQVRFLGGLSTAQRSVFQTAANQWSKVIVGDLPSVRVNDEVIDDLAIDAQAMDIDGPLGILGRAGPTHLRPASLLPAAGIMEFDTADLARMEVDGSLLSVIVHEMGHVLGLGTLWRMLELLQGSGTANPVFVGANAMREFAALTGAEGPAPVPVANTGGPGTREGHWRESVFGNELMTGFLGGGVNPLSRMTIAAMQDMGYQVNMKAADPYVLPSALQLSIMGLGAEGDHQRCSMCGRKVRAPEPVVLPESALEVA